MGNILNGGGCTAPTNTTLHDLEREVSRLRDEIEYLKCRGEPTPMPTLIIGECRECDEANDVPNPFENHPSKRQRPVHFAEGGIILPVEERDCDMPE